MPRIRRILSTACIGLVLAAIAGDAAIAKPHHDRQSGAVIRAWNEIARAQAFGNPVRFSRILAIMHAAQHDAVNGAEPRYETYASPLSDRKADAEAAAAAAAHTVLVAFFPANQAALDAELVESLASVPDGPAERAGVALGRAVGQLLLDVRAGDGFNVPDPFTPTPGPGVWEPTPPAFAPMQMVEVSRDGRRVYVTNSLYGSWDLIFYPDGVGAWAAKLDADPQAGGLAVDARFFPHGDDFRGLRVHQTRLQAGDASSDSYCYTS